MELQLHALVKPEEVDTLESVHLTIHTEEANMPIRQDVLDAIAAEKAQYEAVVAEKNARIAKLEAQVADLESGLDLTMGEIIEAVRGIVP